MAQATLKIHGMDCAEEVAALKAELQPVPGIGDLSFDVLSGKLTVDYADARVSPESLMAAVARTGMRAEPWTDSTTRQQTATGWGAWGRTVTTAASAALLAAGFLTHALDAGWHAAISGHAAPLVAKLFYVGAVLTGGFYVAPKGWRALVRLRPDMNLLMTAAVSGALAIGEFLEAAMVAFLFSVSLFLESWSIGRARRAIAALMSLAPKNATVVYADRREETVDVDQVAVGSTVLVRPGEKFPLDGVISKGETTVDQAPITGESVPVPKSPGSQVYAGTINHDGAVELLTTKPAEDTTLARIVRMVGDAQSKRSPSEQWVERFAHYYTPAVLALALVIVVLPPLMFGGDWYRWFYEGLVLLVIACPCALVISTPVSIVAALTSAARHGVLIKGGPFIEAPSRLKVVAFDKTGTLTSGRLEVKSITPLSGHTADEVLTIAAAVESRSSHPLAQAVVRAAGARGIRPPAADGFQAMKGKGATAILDGRPVWLGSHRLLEQRMQETPEMHQQLEALEADGSSVVVVGNDEHVCGLIALSDQIRSHAADTVQQLHAAGIERTVMLTGDNWATAQAIGRQAGLDEVRAELLPEDKIAAVEDLVSHYGHVAMIGDGINDAPALARAEIGIAMGVVGTDAALETADIALMNDDLRAVPWLIRHSRRTVAIIRQNILASLGVKAAFVVLALAGYASLWAAIAADTGASLAVIANGLRLLHTKATR